MAKGEVGPLVNRGDWGGRLDSEWLAPLGSSWGASPNDNCGVAHARSTIAKNSGEE